jgi:uncharacterized protein (TIGR03437 family)
MCNTIGRAASAAALLMCGALTAATPLAVQQTRYEIKPGQPVQIVTAPETLDFLVSAKSRAVRITGAGTTGIVVSPNRTGDRILLGASLRAKPGEYTVELQATSLTGEERSVALDVAVDSLTPVPSNATRPPVVLLNGWELGFTNACAAATSSSETFGNLAQYLVSDGVPVVYLFDNCLEDPDQTVETLGNDLGTFLNSIQHDNGTQVPQIDLVAHSLGGLIARSYLAGLQPGETLTPPATTLVRDLVLIAVPNFGSFVAANYATGFAVGTQNSELIPGSSFLYNLATWNQRIDDLRGVNAIAVIGNAGNWTASLSATTQLTNASDGIVSLTSASLDFVAQADADTRIVPYCHIDPVDFTNTSFGTFNCNAPGIANVTDTSQETGEIVRSFLSGTTDWKSIGGTPSTDPYLSTKGGMFFATASASDQYLTDVTQVEWGTVTLLPGGDTGTIFYDDFISGTGDFEVTSTSAGTINCETITEALGYYSAARCKINTIIVSVGPLASGPGKVVASGGAITITGSDFGNPQCQGCRVTATPAGSTTPTTLAVSSWTDTSISANLPSTFTGLVTISVIAAAGVDAITVFTVSQSTIAVSQSSLQFAYTVGLAIPATQSFQLTNSGTGALNWTATSNASWLNVSPTSGTAPSTLTISVSPSGLSAGPNTGSIQISAAGASNSPLSVAVTLTVTAAPPMLAVSPTALTFNSTFGGALPASQNISITNAGSGALAWTASDSDFWVGLSPVSGAAPGSLAVSVNPANLAAGTHTSNLQITLAGTAGSPATVVITLVVQGTQPAGAITAVGNGASFQPGFASATWVTIFGTNLSQSTQSWQAADFVGGKLPTSLDGVSVTIDGVAAYVEYISPTQINVLAPDDAAVGTVQVQVTVAGQTSNSLAAQKQQYAPAFFTIDGGALVAARHLNGTLVSATQPAAPGEVIELYATGFGPTNPPFPTADLVTTAVPLPANSVQVTVGGIAATVGFTGLTESGLYQFNVTMPSLPNGDAAVVAQIDNVQTQAGVSIPIQQ